ncbi:hypothetical protein DPMN_123757 [Dreissena polymorpha]|uniref:Uncharacterized protein n=1 Tax=Dreissena polymorpha TaxID=45954 RepID=A0A9D4JVH6_DREPO|nr:hypothetical protein DPMN_123757 [Dreissena polymorpha]
MVRWDLRHHTPCKTLTTWLWPYICRRQTILLPPYFGLCMHGTRQDIDHVALANMSVDVRSYGFQSGHWSLTGLDIASSPYSHGTGFNFLYRICKWNLNALR